jgi:ATP-binding cassette subfamily F protein uup
LRLINAGVRHAAETHAHELETTLNDPEFYATRSREANQLINDLDAAKVEVARLYDRWHELEQIGKPPA